MTRLDWALIGVGLLFIVAGLLVVGAQALVGLALVVLGGACIFVASPLGPPF